MSDSENLGTITFKVCVLLSTGTARLSPLGKRMSYWSSLQFLPGVPMRTNYQP